GRLFEGSAHGEQVADVVGVDVGDDGHAGRCLRDEPVGGEPAERFAQRRAAHAETCGLLHFGDHGTGPQDPRLDLIEQGAIGTIAGAHADLLVFVVTLVYTKSDSLAPYVGDEAMSVYKAGS